MGRKTRILKKHSKFGLKYANHPILKSGKEELNQPDSSIEEFPQPIVEEVFEIEIEPVIEEKIEIKKPIPPKKTTKPKK